MLIAFTYSSSIYSSRLVQLLPLSNLPSWRLLRAEILTKSCSRFAVLTLFELFAFGIFAFDFGYVHLSGTFFGNILVLLVLLCLPVPAVVSSPTPELDTYLNSVDSMFSVSFQVQT